MNDYDNITTALIDILWGYPIKYDRSDWYIPRINFENLVYRRKWSGVFISMEVKR